MLEVSKQIQLAVFIGRIIPWGTSGLFLTFLLLCFLPDTEIPASGCNLPAVLFFGHQMLWHITPGSQLDCQSVSNDCYIDVVFSNLDSYAAPGINPIPLPAADASSGTCK